MATVNNGDWPSRRDLSSDQQKQELIAILDRAAAVHLNAIFLQVRPMADAFYPSALEPWSQFLGATPDYDPLAFAVQEAHSRGLELHAWFNPFRGNPTTALRAYNYGRFVWMDPGDEAVRQRALDVISDVVRRYDIDGVHLDDYFYPYPENNGDFPDEPSWQNYHGRLSRDAWRRDNINRFVREGGSIGAVISMERYLKCPVMFLGLSLPEHGYHAPNENYDWQQASGGMVAFAKYFEEVAAL